MRKDFRYPTTGLNDLSILISPFFNLCIILLLFVHSVLYERDVTELVNATISSLRLTTSSEPPPFDPETLSPVRITYVIIGTLVLFTIAVLIIGNIKHFKHMYCSQTCVEDTARSWGNALADGCMLCLRSVGIVSSDLRLYYGSGFDLTTQVLTQ